MATGCTRTSRGLKCKPWRTGQPSLPGNSGPAQADVASTSADRHATNGVSALGVRPLEPFPCQCHSLPTNCPIIGRLVSAQLRLAGAIAATLHNSQLGSACLGEF